MLEWLEAGNYVDLAGNYALRKTGGRWMKNTLMSLVNRGLATTVVKNGWSYKATTIEPGGNCPLCWTGSIEEIEEGHYSCNNDPCHFEYQRESNG